MEGFAPTGESAGDARAPRAASIRRRDKGENVDAAKRTPVVTTPAGAEGMVPGAETLWRPNDIDDGEVCVGDGVQRMPRASPRTPWRCTKTETRGNERAREEANCRGALPAEANLAEVRAAVEGPRGGCGGAGGGCGGAGGGGGWARGRVAALEWRRRRDYVGAALWHHTARSTEYFSRWIAGRETARIPARIRQRASTSRGSIRSSPSSSPSPSSSLTVALASRDVVSSDGPRHSDITFLTLLLLITSALSIDVVFVVHFPFVRVRVLRDCGEVRETGEVARTRSTCRAKFARSASRRASSPRGSPPRRLCSGANAPRSP